jgi:hypothetical protein
LKFLIFGGKFEFFGVFEKAWPTRVDPKNPKLFTKNPKKKNSNFPPKFERKFFDILERNPAPPSSPKKKL